MYVLQIQTLETHPFCFKLSSVKLLALFQGMVVFKHSDIYLVKCQLFPFPTRLI